MNTKSRTVRLVVGVASILNLLLFSASAADTPKSPPVRVAVDPRVELVSLIFRLAGHPEYQQGRVEDYLAQAEKQFGLLRDHAVVKLARSLRSRYGVSYDAPMTLAVHLSDVDTLQERVPFDPRPDGLDGRWRPEDARTFLQESRRFAQESRFPEFLTANRSLYETTEARMRKLLDDEAHLEWFGDFFGARPQASFAVALALLNGGHCYGTRCRLPDGKEELYCILGVWSTDDDGLPVFDRSMLDTVVHEFCHSYANPVVDRHQAELKQSAEKLFAQVAPAMRRQAYGQSRTLMCESLVRACTVRYLDRYQGSTAAQKAIEANRRRQFRWIGELADLLSQYERQRDRYPTLDAFAPQIVAFFTKYADEHSSD